MNENWRWSLTDPSWI